jgi:purine-nucleoside phosphorylase
MNDHIDEAISVIRRKTSLEPKIACILGSGLGDFADQLSDSISISSADIPYYPVSSVEGHAGRLYFGTLQGTAHRSFPLLIFKGRVHFYESGSIETTLFPCRVAQALGAEYLIVTNAAGGINRQFRAGDLMLIRDTIDLTFIRSPYSPRQQSRRREYFDPSLQNLLRETALDLKIPLQEGTYCWLKGPSYETPAEIRMLSRIGADAIGMSTVPEIIAAQSLGMKVVGISLISNLAAGISSMKLSHEEVTQTAKRVKGRFTALMKEFILRIS